MKKLAIITTHPIQYNAPWFRLLSERGQIAIKVFYTWSHTEKEPIYDPGFDKVVAWDLPLLDGYDHHFVPNTSKSPGSKTFNGIDNPTLIPLVRDWAPTAILVFGWKFRSHLNCIRHFHGKIPVFFRGDSTLVDEQGIMPGLLRTIVLTWVYRHINYALFVGQQNKKYFRKYGVAEHQLVHVPHAVDNARFAEKINQGANTASQREALNITAEDFVFLFAGKLEPKKNVHLLLEAFSELNIPNTQLLIIGNGVLEATLKARYSSNQNIHFVPFQNQTLLPGYYQLADAFILPSEGPGETWGLAVNEAMAAGLPVIVSDKCGCAMDLVEDGRNGYVFKSGDLADLVSKLQLVAQRSKTQQMGEASRSKIKKWSFQQIVDNLETLVKGL